MALAIKPGVFLRRGREGVSAETMAFLIEHKEELQAIYDALDARRDAALEAIAASEAKRAEAEATEQALAAARREREAELAEVVIDLEAREKIVTGAKKVLKDLCDSMEERCPWVFEPMKEN